MKEVSGDLFKFDAVVHCLTTNGDVKANGSAVMGRGVALQAAEMFPVVPVLLGDLIRRNGNRFQLITPIGHQPVSRRTGNYIFASLPVKDHWRQAAKFALIERSLTQLHSWWRLSGCPTVALPRPGCGAGNLEWLDVRLLCSGILIEEEFTVVTL